MQSAKPKLCQYETVKPWALSSTFGALICGPTPLVRGYLLWCEYTVQQTDWCLPCNYTGQNVFILALVYFAGAGVVLAMQKGKRCSRSSWTGWKVFQYTHTHKQHLGHTAPTHCETARGDQSNKLSLFSTQSFWSCLFCSKSMFSLTNFELGQLIILCTHNMREKYRPGMTSFYLFAAKLCLFLCLCIHTA